MRESKVTIKIPRPLYRKIQEVVGESGFDSPTDFIVFVLRDLMGDASQASSAAAPSGAPAATSVGTSPLTTPVGAGQGDDFSPQELAVIRRKLKNLGYL